MGSRAMGLSMEQGVRTLDFWLRGPRKVESCLCDHRLRGRCQGLEPPVWLPSGESIAIARRRQELRCCYLAATTGAIRAGRPKRNRIGNYGRCLGGWRVRGGGGSNRCNEWDVIHASPEQDQQIFGGCRLGFGRGEKREELEATLFGYRCGRKRDSLLSKNQTYLASSPQPLASSRVGVQ